MKQGISFLIVFYLFIPLAILAQFPPPVGNDSTTAMHKDSSAFIGWAALCIDVRGYINISDTTVIYNGSNKATSGHYYYTTGPADGLTMSLGDGGMATLTFDSAIGDRPGPDFAVFENAFNDSFLELAFVEVSSDGNHFVRFPAISLTPESPQIGTFGTLDTRKINNLAGKYRLNYGTPFNLEDLHDSAGIDVHQISHVRIIDAVGCIQNPFATYDSQGHKINDPWPTPFDTGGFDLDAIGVIHYSNVGIEEAGRYPIRIYPNPCQDDVMLLFPSVIPCRVELSEVTGATISGHACTHQTHLDVSGIRKGFYLLIFTFSDGSKIIRKLIKE